jgi:hypothetical protein
MQVWAKRLIILLSGLTLLLGLACFRRTPKRDSVSGLGVNPVAGALQHELNRTRLLRDNRAANPNLLIDPVLAYSTFLGGPQAVGLGGTGQGATVLFVDGSGNAYLGGTTNSANFPVTPGVVDSSNPQSYSLGFVSKIDPTGQSLLFSTYIDGILSVSALAVDSSGNIFVAGSSSSVQGSIVILKLNSTATAII